MIGFLSPLGAIAANLGSFLASLLTVLGITHREPPTPSRADHDPPRRGRLLADTREGLRYVIRHPLLEPILTGGAVDVFFLRLLDATLVLYLRYVRAMPITEIGLVLGLAGLGAPLGSLLSKRAADRLGPSGALVVSCTVNVAGTALLPLFAVRGWTAGLVASGIAEGLGNAVFGPISLPLRQSAAPPDLLGRVNVVQRFLPRA